MSLTPIRFRTNRDLEAVREALRRLLGCEGRASGEIEGDTFRLHPKPKRRSVPITLYGRIEPDRDGTLISAWPSPHWTTIIWVPVWVWFAVIVVHAPFWFVVLGIIVSLVSFVMEARRGYDLLREYVA